MEKRNCPSAPFKEGHLVFAEFQTGELQFLQAPKIISKEEMEKQKSNHSTASFRATMPCVTKGCGNWNGKECTVPNQMRRVLEPLNSITHIEDCPIQKSCQWFAQEGYESCKICPLIKTKYWGT